MTPAARISAAIEILDLILADTPAEKALTSWARNRRFAGSKDRAAVRDNVFDALRCWRSYAALGGAETGRGIMLGALRAAATDPDTLFTGVGHAPAPLTDKERGQSLSEISEAVALDCPDWLVPQLKESLGADFEAVCRTLQTRAPVFLRVNTVKCTRDQAIGNLALEGIIAVADDLSATALKVTDNPRKIQRSQPYLSGEVELQDAASQAVADCVPVTAATRILDYCAGGGGKTLALAARGPARIFAHDTAPQRMRDLPDRAQRAGAEIEVISSEELSAQAPFDVVLCDVPCSGSGAWRRAPEAKWRLTQDRLDALLAIQDDILERTKALVAESGVLAYATCSLLKCENEDRILAFLSRNPAWVCTVQRRLTPLDGGDGFFVALLTRAGTNV